MKLKVLSHDAAMTRIENVKTGVQYTVAASGSIVQLTTKGPRSVSAGHPLWDALLGLAAEANEAMAAEAEVAGPGKTRKILVDGRIYKQVAERNLMSGIWYWEGEGTPVCCSPASETYWSM